KAIAAGTSLGEAVEDLLVALGQLTETGHEIPVLLHPFEFRLERVDDEGIHADAAASRHHFGSFGEVLRHANRGGLPCHAIMLSRHQPRGSGRLRFWPAPPQTCPSKVGDSLRRNLCRVRDLAERGSVVLRELTLIRKENRPPVRKC